MKELWISKGLVIQKQVKNNTDKNEQRFGVILKMSFIFNRIIFYLSCE